MDTGFACTIQRAFLAVVLGILPTSASAAKLSMRNVIHSLEERLTEEVVGLKLCRLPLVYPGCSWDHGFNESCIAFKTQLWIARETSAVGAGLTGNCQSEQQPPEAVRSSACANNAALSHWHKTRVFQSHFILVEQSCSVFCKLILVSCYLKEV